MSVAVVVARRGLFVVSCFLPAKLFERVFAVLMPELGFDAALSALFFTGVIGREKHAQDLFFRLCHSQHKGSRASCDVDRYEDAHCIGDFIYL